MFLRRKFKVFEMEETDSFPLFLHPSNMPYSHLQVKPV